MSSITRPAFRPLRLILRTIVGLVVAVSLYVAASALYVYAHEHDSLRAAAPAGGRFTKAAGVEVFSQAHGPVSDATPILLVHGTAAWSGTWFSLIPALRSAGYPVIAVDLPPFGYSGKSTHIDFSRSAQAERLATVLDAYGVRRAIVVGHSFGAGPALELALHMPERVERVVLVDAALGLESTAPDVDSPACRVLAQESLRWPLLAASAANPLWSKALLRSFVARKESVTDARLREYRRPATLKGATSALGAWAFHFACLPERGDSTDANRIRDLRPPLTLIWGARDTVTPLSQARHLQSLLPQASVHVIDHAGHIPHIEDPARFQRTLLEVLATR
ncbi:alpha/beta fold hydrolase [Lysobacter sp. CFH 32150]|uniref:alpha/beta fold hydrolase n=1 Tax=Lysobacter sp. CFH 32150 TaxID=2927128 RepID=UPI001FA78472|nr:alpha/beta fold hydrolase [Lysobacter sp. CFH 32150]MCI4568276.1 alpha/beta fold hydrolase [Lysobacter sp. CFH 32150]